MRDELVAHLRAAFGWTGEIAVSRGPRGALGQIWRVDIGPQRYAVKEIFDEPPTADAIRIELEFARRAGDCGVQVPLSHPDSTGRYLLTAPDGAWLRCYDWIDLRPVSRHAPDTPRRLGALLACLHRCAPRLTFEPSGGGPPDPWYDSVPAANDWMPVLASGTRWAQRLAEHLRTLERLCEQVRPVDPARLVLCHRDLHPHNVFTGADGRLVVLDCDDLGPADPGRELARVIFDWFCDNTSVDLDAARAMIEAYLGDGGPGRIGDLGDFSMLLAGRLNFVLTQAELVLDPGTEPTCLDYAQQEIDAMLRLMPTPRQVSDVLAVARSCT